MEIKIADSKSNPGMCRLYIDKKDYDSWTVERFNALIGDSKEPCVMLDKLTSGKRQPIENGTRTRQTTA